MLTRALKLTTPRLVLQQLATAIVVALLFLVWLRVPDSSWLYVLATLLVSAALIAAFGIGETRILLKLSHHTGASQVSRKTYLRGTLILVLAFVLWFAWDALLSHIALKYDDLWSGYLNSRFPHSLRNLFSYPHILWLFSTLWSLLSWMGAGLLALFAFHFIATPAPKPAISRNLRSPLWWITFLVLTQFIPWLTSKITTWTPGHGLGIETVSLVLRMSSIVLLDTILITFLLATFATFTTDSPS